MYFGGWLYPDALSAGVDLGEVALGTAAEADCAAIGADGAQVTSAPIKKTFQALWNRMSFLRFVSATPKFLMKR